MSDFLARLLDFIRELWPFREVAPWEKGILVVWGRPRSVVGPGFHLVVPYFMDVLRVSTAVARISTPLQQVTLANGQLLSYSASAKLQVVDPRRALLEVDDYKETAQEEFVAVVAEALMEAPADRFDTQQKRRNFTRALAETLNSRLEYSGVRVTELQFTNWTHGVRTYRLLQDSALTPPGGLTW